jgi:hypothetical protein
VRTPGNKIFGDSDPYPLVVIAKFAPGLMIPGMTGCPYPKGAKGSRGNLADITGEMREEEV